MKKIKSNKKEKKVVSALDFNESSSEKRKKPDKTKKTRTYNRKAEVSCEEIDEKPIKSELIFEGIGEKDPALSQINTDELEYPYWLKPEFLKDSEGRFYASDPDYDPSSLLIPEEEFIRLSAVFQQYWTIKSKNFDKIVFFRLGMALFCFYDDALLLGKIADLKLQFWGTRPFVLIWPKTHRFSVEKLISLGYKAVTVEQMETVLTKKDKICKREIVEIITKGTITEEKTEGNSDKIGGFSEKFLLCIIQKKGIFGLTFVDCMTQRFFFDEVHKIEDLKSIIYRVKPVEIVLVRGGLELGLVNFIRNCSNPAFTNIKHFMKNIEDIFEEFQQFFKEKNDEPGIFHELMKGFLLVKRTNGDLAEEILPNFCLIQSLYLCFSYLKSILIADSIFRYGTFSFFDLESLKSNTLFLDSTTLRNLEVFDVNSESKLLSLKSLFNYLDKTKTPYGKRLLKKWLENPLRNKEEINDRLDAVEDLNKHCNIADYFQGKIAKLPDFERALGRIYNSTNRQKLAYSTFDNFASNRLNEFFKLLEDLMKLMEIIASFDEYKGKFKSKRLRKLVTLKENEGFFPDIGVLKKDIDEMVEICEGIVLPKEGTNERYDEISRCIRGVKEKLNGILMGVKKKLKCSEVVFNHNKVRRFEIEVPEILKEGLPEEYFLTSKKKGVLRFQSLLIENYTEELSSYESSLSEVLSPFFLLIFNKFYHKQSLWFQAIACISELDCLISLSKTVTQMAPYSCRPLFHDKNQMNLLQSYHPCLMEFLPNFVKNDISFPEETSALLITGPNMGGKSTILRQTCISIILAQLGSYVPAVSFELSPFDRIFCRIGANDRILEGKSTFFVEMEESFTIISEATSESFVIFDELGRGTSTYDGLALAYSLLKYMIEDIGCKTLFSTHYHMLIEEFKSFKNIKEFYMEYKYNENTEEIGFLYKFIEGVASGSFGVNVARMAGVPREVLEVAKERAGMMNEEMKKLKGVGEINEMFNKCLSLMES